MPKQERLGERVAEAARNVGGWLELLGSNCCAGRSYRRIDDAKAAAACDGPVEAGLAESSKE